jgi:hypothetical protein
MRRRRREGRRCQAGGTLSLAVEAPNGMRVELQASADFVDWKPVQSAVSRLQPLLPGGYASCTTLSRRVAESRWVQWVLMRGGALATLEP